MIFRLPVIILSLLFLIPAALSAQQPVDVLIARRDIVEAVSLQRGQQISPFASPTAGRAEIKSGFLAVAASLVLPGLGELYAGRFDRGQYPLIAEGVLWLGFAGMNMYGGWIRDDARSFAASAAGVASAGQDDEFFVNIGNYSSVTEYNAVKLVERNLGALYPEDRTSPYWWSWASESDRKSYKDQRIKSDEMYNGAKFFIFGLIANRVWSAIQAAMFVRAHNASAIGMIPSFKSGGSDLSAIPLPDGFAFSFRQAF